MYRERNRERIREYRKSKREVSRALDNAHYARTRERHRELNISRKYGLSVEEYRALLSRGVCDICGRPESAKNKVLSVDHDHNTGRVRGILCNGCNKALGWLRDNPEVMSGMREYLIRNA